MIYMESFLENMKPLFVYSMLHECWGISAVRINPPKWVLCWTWNPEYKVYREVDAERKDLVVLNKE